MEDNCSGGNWLLDTTYMGVSIVKGYVSVADDCYIRGKTTYLLHALVVATDNAIIIVNHSQY
jgi:hypothetical protein